MRILYIIDRPELCGGVKVIFQHADLLTRRGHQVTVFGRGPKPAWIAFRACYMDYTKVTKSVPSQDLVVATYWTTVPLAESLHLGQVAHFCQGFEGALKHLATQRDQIDAVYSHNLRRFAVTPHLADFLKQRFNREAYVVPPPSDPLFRPAFRRRPHRVPCLLIPGIFEAEVKGVAIALQAATLLKKTGFSCKVLRFSTLPLGSEERQLLEPDKYLCGVHPRVAARIMRRSDLLLFPSLPMEGFGLPLLEAMVSGVPVIASDIPSTRYIGRGHLRLVSTGDANAFAEAAREILITPRMWREAREKGLLAAQRFKPEVVSNELENAIGWALNKVSVAA